MTLTAELAKKYKEIILALGEGKEIQYKIKEESTWTDCKYIVFNKYTEYRIKPEQRKIYVTFDEYNKIHHFTNDIDEYIGVINSDKVITFIEQIPE